MIKHLKAYILIPLGLALIGFNFFIPIFKCPRIIYLQKSAGIERSACVYSHPYIYFIGIVLIIIGVGILLRKLEK